MRGLDFWSDMPPSREAYLQKCCEHYAEALQEIRDSSPVGALIWTLAQNALTAKALDVWLKGMEETDDGSV